MGPHQVSVNGREILVKLFWLLQERHIPDIPGLTIRHYLNTALEWTICPEDHCLRRRVYRPRTAGIFTGFGSEVHLSIGAIYLERFDNNIRQHMVEALANRAFIFTTA